MKTTIFAAAILIAVVGLPAEADTVRDWRWLNGTTWYVPKSGLPAYVYTPSLGNSLTPVQDQTVYTITGYRNGYFWGRTAGKLGDGDNEISCMSLVGSVTPEGALYLTFTPYPFAPGDEPTIGIGTMTFKGRSWTMENQMSSGSPSVQIGHWAYMVQTNPSVQSWYSLPGVDMSVTEFMADCMDAAPTVPSPN